MKKALLFLLLLPCLSNAAPTPTPLPTATLTPAAMAYYKTDAIYDVNGKLQPVVTVTAVAAQYGFSADGRTCFILVQAGTSAKALSDLTRTARVTLSSSAAWGGRNIFSPTSTSTRTPVPGITPTKVP